MQRLERLERMNEELETEMDDSTQKKEAGGMEKKAKGEKLPFDIDLDLGLRSSDSDDSDYSDNEVQSYYLANVRKAKKAKEEHKALREENIKLKMENERLSHQNGELMDTLRMASLMGCFENLDKAKSKDATPKMSK